MDTRLTTCLLATAWFLTTMGAGVRADEPFTVSINVDAAQTEGQWKSIWRFFGADEPNYAYMNNGQKLLAELGELAPRQVYFRTHNLLTSGDGTPALKWGSTGAYREDEQGNPIYDWTILDRIFDTYLQHGVRPYVQIGFMPEDLSIKPEPYQHSWHPGAKYEEIYTGWAYPPKDYDKWAELVYQWTKHCVDRYGESEVENWYWQVWNEANIGYWRGTPTEFLKLHDYAIAAVRRALPSAKVGGADTAGSGGRFTRRFLEHCLRGENYATGEQGTPLDFVSFHAKGAPVYVDGHVRMGIANQLRTIDEGFELVASFPELKDKPIVIGESDPEGCAACQGPQLAYRNGTMYSSYTAASFARKLDLADKHGVNFEGALTWAFQFEDQPYFAGFRSLATGGIDKPVLNVFRMFSRMGGQRLAVQSDHETSLDTMLQRGVREAPDVTALATLDGNQLCVLVWHYHDDDRPGPTADVELALENLPADWSTARVEHFRIDEELSNAFTAWKRLGSPQQPSAEQYAQLESAGKLARFREPHHVEISQGKATLGFPLPRQAVSLLIVQGEPGQVRADAARPGQRRQRAGGRPSVYKMRIDPHWFGESTHFWYRNDLADGRREFVVVNAERGERRAAFDHQRLATALAETLHEEVSAERLPLQDLQFELAEDALQFRSGGKFWKCDLHSYELSEVQEGSVDDDAAGSREPAREVPTASTRTGPELTLTFVNKTAEEVELFWLDERGLERSYGKLAAGQTKDQHSYEGHVWEIRNLRGEALTRFEAAQSATNLTIDAGTPRPQPRRRRAASRSPRSADGTSPDGLWTAFVRDYDVFVRSAADDEEFRLSEDGREGHAYDLLQWSPDSKTLVAFRVKPAERQEVYLVESSPPGGGRARLQTRPYALPGDDFTSYELHLFDITDRREINCDVQPIDFGRPGVRWRNGGSTFAYQQTDRGHQRFRVIEVNARTGESRSLIDERSETFIWAAHTENLDLELVNWLEDSDEIIFVSERDGWRHLYLIDAKQGLIKNQITHGGFVVRGIDLIDEQTRQVWFHASGMNSSQDPYLIHYYRVGFDGSGLVALTEGDGNHSVQYSPDRHYLIDTYSRVDSAPVHELRRVSDGNLLCRLETADTADLDASGWQAPEVFSAKGRDGQTEIWGIICRPRNFDPDKKYPVIEDIYAGPQGSFTPKSFSARDRYGSLNELGFIVVKIDGMGTANRSKAFHDVCWRNLKDAGFEDRICWMKAAAARYPQMDLDRVGVYGTSAGGQNAAGALLFHPEFYKVAVANCGCHDNRLDKASWNEQWMGYPVGPWYGESSNIDNAHRLHGKLFLIVGELDTNVPPESTYRFVDALIKADKDFDLLVVPGAGHGVGGPYVQRRRDNFFARHLKPDS